MRKSRFSCLVLILLLAAFLRFYRLGDYPPSFWQDICSIGYDAYSLLKTGKDHWGNPFPHLYLRSLGDFKLPIFTYLTIPGVALFGLNEFAVRFPSALFGVLTVLLTFFLVRELFADFPPPRRSTFPPSPFGLQRAGAHLRGVSRQFSNLVSQYPSILISLFASFLLAISPWHIGLTRHGYEAGLAVFFQSLALFLFLKSRRKPFFLPISILFFSLTVYTYHSFRLFTPLFLGGLAWFFRKDFQKQKKLFWLSLCLFLLLISPSLFSFFTPIGGTRMVANRFDRSLEWKEKLNDCQFFCNKSLVFILTFVKNYLSQFSSDFLFVFGSTDPVLEIPSRGYFYYFWAPLFIFGLLALLKSAGKEKLLIFLWLFLFPLPASITSNPYHPARTAQLIPLVEMISALGFFEVLKLFQKKQICRFAFLLLSSAIAFFSLGKYFVDYYARYPLYSHPTYQKIHKRLYGQLADIENHYSKIYITRRAQPYIYLLFFSPIEPAEFQKLDKELEKNGEAEETKEAHFERIGKFYFFKSLPKEIESNALIIGSPYDFPVEFKPETLFEINDFRGNLVFFAFEAKELERA